MRQLTHFITLIIKEYGTPGKSATKCGEEYQISFFYFIEIRLGVLAIGRYAVLKKLAPKTRFRSATDATDTKLVQAFVRDAVSKLTHSSSKSRTS